MALARQPEDRRRRLGAYYTPERVAEPIVRWALSGAPGHVLDPSFGGCGFLNVALRQIEEMGSQTAGKFIFGVDVDRRALDFTSNLRQRGVPADHLRISDFFRERAFGGAIPPCQAVVGNPPYIRHHWFQSRKRHTAQRALERISASLPESSSAWAYFVLYASAFVAHGGRLAMLLPTSAAKSRYATRVLEELQALFGEVTIVSVGGRLFPEVREGTVVLLASQRGGTCSHVQRLSAAGLQGLEGLLSALQTGQADDPVDESVSSMLRALDVMPHVRSLGDLADVRIGVVTGSNSFFLRTRDEERRLKARGVRFVPIVSGARQLNMLRWTARDQSEAEEAGFRNRLMLMEPKARRRSFLRSEIRRARESAVHMRSHCQRRASWFQVEDCRVPDAFFKYMSASGPFITLNDSAATCTNCLHRLYWRRSADPHVSLVVGARSTLYRLSAEFVGRRYAGGLLKLEPSDAKRLLVPIVGSAARIANRLDAMEREGDYEGARELADRVVLREGLGLSWRHIARLDDALHQLHSSFTG